MGLARRLWNRITKRSAPPVHAIGNRATVSGVSVTPDSSLTIAAVWAAVNVISTDSACLPLRVVRHQPDGTFQPEPNDPRTELLECSPDDGDTTSFGMRQALMGHVLTWGNGYLQVVRDERSGMPIRLTRLSPEPWRTKPYRNPAGRLMYEINGGRAPSILGDNVVQVSGLGWDGLSGYSPVAMMREAMGLSKAAEVFGAAFFGNGTLPGGFIKVKGEMDDEIVANLRESIESMHQGADQAWRIAILEEGYEWQSLSMPLEQAQFLQARQFQVVEIARAFRLPPSKIGDYSEAHHTNVEEANSDYISTCLMGWLVAIEQAFNLKLFTRAERAAGLRVQHDMTALLRGNMLARAQYYKEMFAVSGISPNEIARRENLPAVEGGDQRFVPLNFVPIHRAGSSARRRPSQLTGERSRRHGNRLNGARRARPSVVSTRRVEPRALPAPTPAAEARP